MRSRALRILLTVQVLIWMAAATTPGPVAAGVVGSLGAEAWYAQWRVEGGLESLGIEVEYEMDPTVIFGYSASFSYERDGAAVTGILVDYFTAKIDGEMADETDGGQDYALLRGGLVQRLSRHYLIHADVARGKFSGTAKLGGGAEAFGHTPGDRVSIDADWFRADVVLLHEVGRGLFGVGYRYLRYNKPQAMIDFYGHEVNDKDRPEGTVEADEVIAGRFLDTEMTGHYLLLGAWDRTHVGLPPDGWLLYEADVFLGSESVDNGEDRLSGRIGMGLEAALGAQYTLEFFSTGRCTARFGYRLLYAVNSVAEEKGEDENGTRYTGTIARDLWHGPFVGLVGSF
jgi:hypothetical protein